jgi:predicted nucleic acid-binding protein
LTNEEVLAHPFVIGELALGYLPHRESVLRRLRVLPSSPIASFEEVLHFVERNRLFGKGIGYIDAHLLTGVLLVEGARLWTFDKALRALARQLRVAYEPLQ